MDRVERKSSYVGVEGPIRAIDDAATDTYVAMRPIATPNVEKVDCAAAELGELAHPKLVHYNRPDKVNLRAPYR